MRASADRDRLRAALEAIGWVLKGRARRAEERVVRVEARYSDVTLTVREEPFHAQAPIDSTVTRSGRAFVDFDALQAIAGAAPPGEIALARRAHELEVTAEGHTIYLPEKPSFLDNQVVLARSLAIPTKVLRRALRAVGFAMGDPLNPVQGFTRISTRPGWLRALAFNRVVIARARLRCDGAAPGAWGIPAELVQQILRQSSNDDSEALVASGPRHVWISTPAVELTGPALEHSEWPMLSSHSRHVAIASRSTLTRTIGLIRAAYGNAPSIELRLELANGVLHLRCTPPEDAVARFPDPRCPVGHRGGAARLTTTIGPFADAIEHAASDIVEIGFPDADEPLEVRSAAPDATTSALVMPWVRPRPS